MARLSVKLAFWIVLGAATAAGAELVARGYFSLAIARQLEEQKRDGRHYFQSSSNPRLAYELRPGFQQSVDGRKLRINTAGLRGAEIADAKTAPRVVILGDSVVFGVKLDDALALPRVVERSLAGMCSQPVEVLNLAVPGYGTAELLELLQAKAEQLRADAVLYVMNLNDFARRDTIYEGADDGLYRMYAPPTWRLPFLVRKAIYRWHKGTIWDGLAPTLAWYRWLIRGTARETLDGVGAMGAWATAKSIGFTVFLLPSGLALRGGSNALAQEHRLIRDEISARGISVEDGERPLIGRSGLFDETDHLSGDGVVVVAKLLATQIVSTFSRVAAQAGCRTP